MTSSSLQTFLIFDLITCLAWQTSERDLRREFEFVYIMMIANKELERLQKKKAQVNCRSFHAVHSLLLIPDERLLIPKDLI